MNKKSKNNTVSKDYLRAVKYVDTYWEKATFNFKQDLGRQAGLPHPFVSASVKRFKNDQFYWDSYFIILGLVESGKIELAKGMVNNFVHLFKRFGVIPTSNRFYKIVMSHPPFLTSMALAVFTFDKDKQWLKNIALTAEEELKTYWLNEKHLIQKGLSRYCDYYCSHLGAEYESGWDRTSRFKDKCLNYVPIDLNCCLYKYERDLYEIYLILGNKRKSEYYKTASIKRRAAVNRLMWNEKKGFFFDFDYVSGKQSTFYSLAGYFTLWSGLASQKQAAVMIKQLKRFETKWGLANTQKENLLKPFRQWDYPNGWANMHHIVLIGLLNYDYQEDSMRISEKWIRLNLKLFKETGKFWEKYDVTKGKLGKDDTYEIQEGFGWTNALFKIFAEKVIERIK